MQSGFSCKHTTLIVTAFQNFLNDRIRSFLEFSNRINENEVVNETEINMKAKCLQRVSLNFCPFHSTKGHSKTSRS
jgi:hypothetical protein